MQAEPDGQWAVVRAVHDLNTYLRTRAGYIIDQSPLALHDERWLVLYEIERSEARYTGQGPEQVYYVSQVTKFRDGKLRGGSARALADYDNLIKAVDMHLMRVSELMIPYTEFRNALMRGNKIDTKGLINAFNRYLQAALRAGDNSDDAAVKRNAGELGISADEFIAELEKIRGQLSAEDGDLPGMLNEIRAIMANLRKFSVIEQGDLERLLNGIKNDRVTLEFDWSADKSAVMGNMELLKLVFRQGGINGRPGKVTVRAADDDECWSITFSGDGRGSLRGGSRGYNFEVFRDIIESMNGKISVISEAGKGSTLIIQLPKLLPSAQAEYERKSLNMDPFGAIWMALAGALPFLVLAAYGVSTGQPAGSRELYFSAIPACLGSAGLGMVGVFALARRIAKTFFSDWYASAAAPRAGPAEVYIIDGVKIVPADVSFLSVKDGSKDTIEANPMLFKLLKRFPLATELLLYVSGSIGHEVLHLLGITGDLEAWAIAQAIPAMAGILAGFGISALGAPLVLALSAGTFAALVSAMIISFIAISNTGTGHASARRPIKSNPEPAKIISILTRQPVSIDKIRREETIEDKLRAAVEKFKEAVRPAASPADIDKALADFERVARSLLAEKSIKFEKIRPNVIISMNIPEVSKIHKSLVEVNRYLRGRTGHVIDLSPRGLEDERWFVLYKINRSSLRDTNHGSVNVYHVEQVTQFSDNGFRGGAAWNSYIEGYVLVYSRAFSKNAADVKDMVAAAQSYIVSGKGRRTKKGTLIDRISGLHIRLMFKGLNGKSVEEIQSIHEEFTIREVIEYECQARLLGLLIKDTDVNPVLYRQLAKLQSIIKGDEPFSFISNLLGLVADDNEARYGFAWNLLARLAEIELPKRKATVNALSYERALEKWISGSETLQGKIIENLEIMEEKSGPAEIRQRAQKVYAEVAALWDESVTHLSDEQRDNYYGMRKTVRRHLMRVHGISALYSRLMRELSKSGVEDKIRLNQTFVLYIKTLEQAKGNLGEAATKTNAGQLDFLAHEIVLQLKKISERITAEDRDLLPLLDEILSVMDDRSELSAVNTGTVEELLGEIKNDRISLKFDWRPDESAVMGNRELLKRVLRQAAISGWRGETAVRAGEDDEYWNITFSGNNPQISLGGLSGYNFEVCKDTIESMNGEITYKTENNNLITLTIRLPKLLPSKIIKANGTSKKKLTRLGKILLLLLAPFAALSAEALVGAASSKAIADINPIAVVNEVSRVVSAVPRVGERAVSIAMMNDSAQGAAEFKNKEGSNALNLTLAGGHGEEIEAVVKLHYKIVEAGSGIVLYVELPTVDSGENTMLAADCLNGMDKNALLEAVAGALEQDAVWGAFSDRKKRKVNGNAVALRQKAVIIGDIENPEKRAAQARRDGIALRIVSQSGGSPASAIVENGGEYAEMLAPVTAENMAALEDSAVRWLELVNAVYIDVTQLTDEDAAKKLSSLQSAIEGAVGAGRIKRKVAVMVACKPAVAALVNDYRRCGFEPYVKTTDVLSPEQAKIMTELEIFEKLKNVKNNLDTNLVVDVAAYGEDALKVTAAMLKVAPENAAMKFEGKVKYSDAADGAAGLARFLDLVRTWAPIVPVMSVRSLFNEGRNTGAESNISASAFANLFKDTKRTIAGREFSGPAVWVMLDVIKDALERDDVSNIAEYAGLVENLAGELDPGDVVMDRIAGIIRNIGSEKDVKLQKMHLAAIAGIFSGIITAQFTARSGIAVPKDKADMRAALENSLEDLGRFVIYENGRFKINPAVGTEKVIEIMPAALYLLTGAEREAEVAGVLNSIGNDNPALKFRLMEAVQKTGDVALNKSFRKIWRNAGKDAATAGQQAEAPGADVSSELTLSLIKASTPQTLAKSQRTPREAVATISLILEAILIDKLKNNTVERAFRDASLEAYRHILKAG